MPQPTQPAQAVVSELFAGSLDRKCQGASTSMEGSEQQTQVQESLEATLQEAPHKEAEATGQEAHSPATTLPAEAVEPLEHLDDQLKEDGWQRDWQAWGRGSEWWGDGWGWKWGSGEWDWREPSPQSEDCKLWHRSNAFIDLSGSPSMCHTPSPMSVTSPASYLSRSGSWEIDTLSAQLKRSWTGEQVETEFQKRLDAVEPDPNKMFKREEHPVEVKPGEAGVEVKPKVDEKSGEGTQSGEEKKPNVEEKSGGGPQAAEEKGEGGVDREKGGEDAEKLSEEAAAEKEKKKKAAAARYMRYYRNIRSGGPIRSTCLSLTGC